MTQPLKTYYNAGLCALLLFTTPAFGQNYIDVAAAGNVKVCHKDMYGFSSGVSCADFDGDGLDDITLASQTGDSIWFFKNIGNGFVKIQAPVAHTAYSAHVIWVDYDNDGDKDLYVSSVDIENKLYRNDSTLGFTDVTFSSGIYAPSEPSYGATWGDYNKDGWLDLYQSNRTGKNFLYLNNGAGGFSNVSSASGTASYDRYSFSPVFFDFNNDGLKDLWVTNDKYQPCELYKNMGDSSFTEISSSSGTNVALDAMTATVADYNNDGYLDMYVTNTPIGGNKLLHNNGNETFTELADSLGIDFHGYSWAATFFDYANDGDLDLYISEKHMLSSGFASRSLWDYTGSGFAPVSAAGFVSDTLKSHSHALGDFNGDGHYDIVSPNQFPDSLQLWQSREGKGGWVKVRLEGTRSNRDGIGSWIIGYAGTNVYRRYTTCGSGYLSQNSSTHIIGMGSHSSLDSLEVRWLSGYVDKFYELDSGQTYLLVEGSSLSAELLVAGDTTFCQGDSIQMQLQTKKTYAGYQWSTGDTTAAVTVTSPGQYHVVVTDSFGFTSHSDSMRIQVDSMSLAGRVKHDSLGASVGEAYVQVIGGFPPFQYHWNDPLMQTDSVAVQLAQGSYKVVVTDSLGCTDSLSFTVENPLSTSDDGYNPISLFPNPAVSEVRIFGFGSESIHYKLSTVNGQIIKQGILHSPHHLWLEDIPPGLYQIVLSASNGPATTEKLIVRQE